MDLRALAAFLKAQGLAGKNLLFLVCVSDEVAQELIDLLAPEFPSAEAWAWPYPVWVQRPTGLVAGGNGYVNDAVELLLDPGFPVPPNKYVAGGNGPLAATTTAELPMRTPTLEEIGGGGGISGAPALPAHPSGR